MSKYDNYIYLTICEVSLETYKTTNYSSYVEYCKGMCNSLDSGDVSNRDRRHIGKIVEVLDKIFTLSPEVSGKYIGEYFSLNSVRHSEFQNLVQITKELFPMIG